MRILRGDEPNVRAFRAFLCDDPLMASGRLGQTIEGAAEKWARAAAKSQPFAPGLPLHRFAGEAFELALFIEEYWEPRPDLEVPGLAVLTTAAFNRETAGEIRELALAVLHWKAKRKAAYAPVPAAPVQRARLVRSELLGALEFLFGPERKSRANASLRRLRDRAEPTSHDGLALALESVARLCVQHRRALAKLPGGQLTLLDEAGALARALREHSAIALTASDARATLRNTRLRVSRLLHDRVTAARAAIRFAFRAHPDLVALATSEYKRTARASQRAKSNTR